MTLPSPALVPEAVPWRAVRPPQAVRKRNVIDERRNKRISPACGASDAQARRADRHRRALDCVRSVASIAAKIRHPRGRHGPSHGNSPGVPILARAHRSGEGGLPIIVSINTWIVVSLRCAVVIRVCRGRGQSGCARTGGLGNEALVRVNTRSELEGRDIGRLLHVRGKREEKVDEARRVRLNRHNGGRGTGAGARRGKGWRARGVTREGHLLLRAYRASKLGRSCQRRTVSDAKRAWRQARRARARALFAVLSRFRRRR